MSEIIVVPVVISSPCSACWKVACPSLRSARPSFNTLRSVAVHAVNHSGVGCAERDPVLHVELQRNEELLAMAVVIGHLERWLIGSLGFLAPPHCTSSSVFSGLTARGYACDWRRGSRQ